MIADYMWEGKGAREYADSAIDRDRNIRKPHENLCRIELEK